MALADGHCTPKALLAVVAIESYSGNDEQASKVLHQAAATPGAKWTDAINRSDLIRLRSQLSDIAMQADKSLDSMAPATSALADDLLKQARVVSGAQGKRKHQFRKKTNRKNRATKTRTQPPQRLEAQA